MNDWKPQGPEMHLEPEQIERLALASPPETAPEALRAHVRECPRCAHEVTETRRVIEALAELPRMAPSPGFADAVMERVSLPRPWHVRAWEFVASRWLVLSALLVTATGSAIGIGRWVAGGRPVPTPGRVLGFLGVELRRAFWGAVVDVGRYLVTSGIAHSVQVFFEHLTLTGAAAAVGGLGLLGLTASLVLFKLLRDARPELATLNGASR